MPRSQAAGETYLALRTANLNEPQPAMSGFKLNLGCGTTRIPGYIGVDVNRGGGADLIASATCLPFKEGSIAEVFTSHMLEHLLGMDLDLAMREIHRTLMPQDSYACGSHMALRASTIHFTFTRSMRTLSHDGLERARPFSGASGFVSSVFESFISTSLLSGTCGSMLRG